MPYDSINPSQPLSEQSALNPQMNAGVAREVAGKLQSGENPLDFVKKNLAKLNLPPEQPINPQQLVAQEEQKRAAAEDDTIPQADPFAEEVAPVIEEPAAPDAQPEPQEPVVDAEPTEDGETPPPGSAAANFKQVRKVLHETKTQLSTTQQELEAAKEELSKYQRGEVLPEVLQEKEAEIARLSRYEKMLSLKTSKEYQEKFVAPLSQITTKLTEMAKDYNLPPELLQKALRTSSRADLNRFLAQHFDDIGALEVKQLVRQAQELQGQAKAAEQEPQSALQELMAQGQQAADIRKAQSRREIQDTTRQVWAESFQELVDEGQAQELIYSKDDPEHNRNYVEPLVKQAAQEYGKIVTQLVEQGLEKMPPALGKALAKAVLLAHASAVALETRDSAARMVEEMEDRTSRLNKIYRPPVGSNAPGSETMPQQRVAQTPVEAGRGLINSVLANKRA